jgi:hypothetical protein
MILLGWKRNTYRDIWHKNRFTDDKGFKNKGFFAWGMPATRYIIAF